MPARTRGTLCNLLGVLLASGLTATTQCSPSSARGPCDAFALLQSVSLRTRARAAGPPELEGAQPPKRFGDVLKEMRQLWKSHKRETLAKLNSGRLREEDERSAQHRGTQATSEPYTASPPEVPPEEEREREADGGVEAPPAEEPQQSRYGDAMDLVVRDALGRETSVKFRSATRLRVLMYSVCRRLALLPNETHFLHEDKEIQPNDTPTSLGLEEQDVIEVRSKLLDNTWMRMLKQREEEARQEMVAAQREQTRLQAHAERAHEELQRQKDVLRKKAEVQHQMEAAAKRQKDQKDKSQAKLQDEAEKVRLKAEREKNGYIDLQFVDLAGKMIHISVKRDVWLGGTMDLMCKRYRMHALRTCFFIEVTHAQIVARDTAENLGLDMDEIIRVKPCAQTKDDESEWS
mmetsp:Transcript_78091/g.207239  ORF Transcript_78091/g.207239 Transcript_78091/m.207239 type:complete len:405 (-) Transcript_78091:115-1329(-)